MLTNKVINLDKCLLRYEIKLLCLQFKVFTIIYDNLNNPIRISFLNKIRENKYELIMEDDILYPFKLMITLL
jgi:hypothetical protein